MYEHLKISISRISIVGEIRQFDLHINRAV